MKSWETKLPYYPPLKCLHILNITNKFLFVNLFIYNLFKFLLAVSYLCFIPTWEKQWLGKKKIRVPHQGSYLPALTLNHDISFLASVYAPRSMQPIFC